MSIVSILLEGVTGHVGLLLLHGTADNADTGLDHEGTGVGGADFKIDGQRGEEEGAVGVDIVIEAVEGLPSSISAGGDASASAGNFQAGLVEASAATEAPMMAVANFMVMVVVEWWRR